MRKNRIVVSGVTRRLFRRAATPRRDDPLPSHEGRVFRGETRNRWTQNWSPQQPL